MQSFAALPLNLNSQFSNLKSQISILSFQSIYKSLHSVKNVGLLFYF